MKNAVTAITFTNFAKAKQYFEKYFRDNYHPMKSGGSLTVKQFNNRIKDNAGKIDTLSDDDLYCIRWECKHFGNIKPKAVSSTNARNREHMRCGCRFFVYLSWQKALGVYKVNRCHLIHNHEIGPELYRHYASSRRPDEEYKQIALDMLSAGVKPSKVAEALNSDNISVTVKDIYNLRRSMKCKGTQSLSDKNVPHTSDSPISLAFKLAILDELDKDHTESFVSQKFNVPKTLVTHVRLKGKEIRAMALQQMDPSSSNPQLEQMEEILKKWILFNLPDDCLMVSAFVRHLAENMYKSVAKAAGVDPDGFRATKEWLGEFVKRHDLDCLIWVEEDTMTVTSTSSSQDPTTTAALDHPVTARILKRNETPEEREKRLEKRRLRRLQETPEQRARTAEANTMSKVGVDQDAKLIAAVEHNRCLYDAGDPDYDNEVMKENVWQMIAKSMDVTVDRAKSRWHSLEALYQKSLNSVNKIHLFGKMSFLRPHLNAETREEPKPIDEQSTISIKTEVISSDEEFADTVEATPSNMGAVGLIMVDPYKKSSVPLVTYENQHDRSPLEDLEMKVEEEIEEDEETDEVEEENYDILEEPHNSTSANSSLCHIPPSDTSFTEAKLQEVSESFAKKRKFTKKLLKSEVPKPDQDLEYFKGFMSMIKELNAKRKRQLFASFAQELFRLLEEQELEESESTET